MQLLVKLLIYSLYGQQIKKDSDEKYACKSELWTSTENDERVEDYCKTMNGYIYIVKMLEDERMEDNVKNLNTMPLHLGGLVISNSKKI